MAMPTRAAFSPSSPGGRQEGENPKHEAKDGRACAANDCEREWHGDQAPNPEDDGEDRPEPGCEAVARPHLDDVSARERLEPRAEARYALSSAYAGLGPGI